MSTEIYVFILTFIFVFIIYQLFLVRKCKKDRKRKQPVEVQYLVNRYKLDLEKLNYKRLLNVISLISSLDIALVVTVISLWDSFLTQIIIGFISAILIILVTYSILGYFYKKKGMTKNV